MGLEAELKEYARSIGLDAVGIARADPFTRAEAALHDRVARGLRSSFEEPDIRRRCYPADLLPGVRSIIAAGIAYVPPPAAGTRAAATASLAAARPAPWAPSPPADAAGPRGWLSRYCRSPEDYHRLLHRRLARLADWLRARHPEAGCHIDVDTGPPVDREVAERAGLGSYGKSTLLIHPEYGTWLFLGEILTTLELAPDTPWTGTCGACTRCIDACPTGAIIAPYELDSLRCLSYVTQMRGPIPAEFREPMGRMLFGCDICQDVCPYNLRPSLLYGEHPEFAPAPELGGDDGPDLAAVLRMTRGQFKRWFAPTAASWRGKTVLQRNAVIALGNSGDARALPLLQEALQDGRRVVRGHAAWAIGRLGRLAGQAGDAGVHAGARQALAVARAAEPDLQVRQELDAALESLADPVSR